MTVWYQIPDFPGYRISLRAEVMSLKFSEPRIMKPWPDDKNMHWKISLRQNGRYVNTTVHALMALTFIGPRPPGLQVCHNNGDGFDNRLTNLRYDTPSANNLDQVRHGTHSESSRTHCDNGHEWTPQTTMWRWGKGGKKGGTKYRLCRKCHNLYMARYRARKKAGLV